MINILQWILGALILVASLLSVYNSFRSRRSVDARLRGLYASRMNMSMGLMLILIALIQMLLFEGSSIRVVVGSVFFLLGMFNLFAGIRNHSHFKKLPS
ncbi:YtpI family protein [Cohnella faecalis]|uniref:YtpI-like protein n=1 Tax=Cohnella faecalis TaxID=2315694 RepID=A0A398CLS6_9BACL|nr:YtpI family protein [Cohnella faecalis]RIE03210.1 hypothetical protein D3H35_19840 [Cohnella faecalis]